MIKKNILFVIHKLGYGGAEKNLTIVANQLSRFGYDIQLLTYESQETIPTLDPGIQHIHFQMKPPAIYGIRRFSQIIQVRKIFKQFKPDLVISFLNYPNMISILAATGTKIPVIIAERGDPFAMPDWFTRLRDWIYSFADGVIFQTRGAQKYYSGKIQQKSIIIHNPIDSSEIPSRWLGEKEEIIVHAGRFELKQKRQDLLIRAFCRIAASHPKVRLYLLGDGEDEQEIIRLISEYHMQSRIILAGVTRNIYESIRKARMFVLCSDYEGMPNALMEAMSVGLPCISTDCSPGGAAELITHMNNGILVKPGSVEDLAASMELLLNDPTLANRLGENALKIKETASPDKVMEKWLSIINKFI